MLRGITINRRVYKLLLKAGFFYFLATFLSHFSAPGNFLLAQPSIILSKTAAPEPVNTGSQLTYTIIIVNNGSGPAQQVRLYDTISELINPVYRIQPDPEWVEWQGTHFFGTIPHSLPNNTKTVFIRGTVPLNQCSNFSNTAYVSHDAAPGYISATVNTTINDNQPPAIICPPNIAQDTDPGTCQASVTIVPATATDNCGIASIVGTRNDGQPLTNSYPVGVTTITWVATDLTGNTSNCLQTVVVTDNEYPQISCPGNIVAETNPGSCVATVITPNPTFSDNCQVVGLSWTLTGATTGASSLIGIHYLGTHNFNRGLTTVTYRVEDSSGNKSTCAFTVTVEDNQDPIINCTTNKTVNANNGFCTYLHNGIMWNATGSDNCTVSSLAYELSGATTGTGTTLHGVVFNLGVTTVTWTITDGSGNTTQCSFTVTVNDNQNPTINCPGNQVVTNDTGTCSYTHNNNSWNATANDNCSVSSITYSLSGATSGTGTSLNGVTFNVGLTTVTWIATDGSGNTAQCSFTVNVQDVEFPTISCQENQSVNTDSGVCTYTHNGTGWDATGADNCSGYSITYALSGATTGNGLSLNNVTFNLGITTVTWTIADASNNTVQCSFTVTVSDIQNPVINCPGNQLVNTNPGVCTYTHTGNSWNAIGSDNCTISSITYELSGSTSGNGTSLNGVTFNLGITTVTWTITDGSGNIAECSFTVTVEDHQIPAISCPGNQTVSTNTGTCTFTQPGTAWDATGSDNCSVSSLLYSLTGVTTGSGTSLAGVTFNLGVTNVSWTITDGSGNTNECAYTITVQDHELPVINCAGNQSVPADPGVCTYTHSGTAWDATGSDNCSISSITYVMNGATTGSGNTLNGVVFNDGTTNITWTITDGSGNTSQCTHTVTVNDLENPVINCTGNQTVNTDPGTCTYTHIGVNWDAVGSDNCTIASLTYTLNGATSGNGTSLNNVAFNLGVTTVTWNVADNNGNTAQCSFTVTVLDQELPLISCTGNQTVNTSPNACTYTHSGSAWNATGTDNCSVSSITYALSGATTGTGTTLHGVVFNLGATTVTWTIIDGSGNSAQCSFSVTVEDHQNPLINCPGNQTVNTNPGVCHFIQNGTAWDATGSDNCTVTSLTYELTGATTGSGTTLNGVIFNLGATTVTWTITDNSGNTNQCSYQVNVIDNELPQINCVGNQSVNTNTGVCQYTHTGTSWDATASDNCSVGSLSYVMSGATTGSGTSLNGVVFNSGNTLVAWTAIDSNGNSANCNYNVLVIDNEPPVIHQCAANQNVNLNANCQLLVPNLIPQIVATDNCTNPVIITQNPPAGTLLPSSHNQQHTITFTVSDAANNSVTCSAVLTGKDISAPVITCTTNKSVNTNLGVCTYTHTNNLWNPVVNDNCTVASLTYTLTGATSGTGTSLNGTVFNKGLTTVTWTAVDDAGNTSSCFFPVTVNDNQPPVVQCPSPTSFIRYTPANACTYVVNGNEFNLLGFSDNCSVASVTYQLQGATTGSGVNTLAGVTLNLGTTIIRWFVTDESGNINNSCVLSVQVIDNVPPVFVNCQPLIIFPCPDQIPPPDPTTLIAVDNCGNPVTVVIDTVIWFGVGNVPGFCPDSIIHRYKAIDASGNVAYCSQKIKPLSPCGCNPCQTQVPNFNVNLESKCDSVWVSPPVVRSGCCCPGCGGHHNNRCVSFQVKIGPNAVGFYILMNGATPPAFDFQVNCGPPNPLGVILCVPPGIYHTVTICKPGGNANVYSIHSVCGLIFPQNIETRIGCEKDITVTGVPESTITWHNITGDYLHYLSGSPNQWTSPNGHSTVYFTADTLAPPVIKYRVCGGYPNYPCGPGDIICDTVTVHVRPEVIISITPDPPVFCHNDPKQIVASVTPVSLSYLVRWYDEYGTLLGDGTIFHPPDSGRYYVSAYDPVSPLPCSYDTMFFNVQYMECLTCPPEQFHCSTDDIIIYNSYQDFMDAGAHHDFPCEVAPATFNLAEEISDGGFCPEIIIHRYALQDICGNRDTCEVMIVINDLIPPTFSMPADTIYCVEDLINALYNPVGVYPIDDLTYPRPDYYLHLPGNTVLDLIDLDDNCTPPWDLLITWEFDFGYNGNIDMVGSGQLSLPPPIYFPVGTNMLYFTVTDACGNSTTLPLTLIVEPRPDIQDDY